MADRGEGQEARMMDSSSWGWKFDYEEAEKGSEERDNGGRHDVEAAISAWSSNGQIICTN